MKQINSIVWVLLIFANFTFAQDERKRANFWHFGSNAGLNFTCPPPTGFSGSPLVSNEGSASISDLNGNLLMFTNGQTVWDRNNNVMPNGTGLLGNQSTVQSAVIVPHPGNTDRYFVFTAGTSLEDNGTIGVRFSEVDMTLNGGFGDVLPGNKNTLLFVPNEEKLTAVRNAAGNGYWVTAQEKSSDRWYTYEVTASGVNMTPVISVTGPPARANNSLGAKFSPDGTMLVSQAGCGSGMSSNANLVLYSFNNATGVIEYAWSDCGQPGFAIEFSPDCTKLYATSNQHIFQYDLSLGVTITDSVPVKASKIQITSATGNRGLQLGNDCKIYVRETGTSIGVIQNPNLPGLACNYVQNSFNLVSGSNGQCFPNFVQSFFTNNCDNLDFDLTAQDAGCNSDGAITLTINQGIAPFDFLWSNGETTQNISGLSGGWYSVTVTDFNGCPLTDSIFINQPPTALIENAIVTNPTTCGATDGSIDLTISLVGGSNELITSETFETDGVGTRYTVVGAENSSSRFFKRGQSGDFNFSGGAFSGEQGTHYFGARRTTALPATLTLNPITITGYSNLELCIWVASSGNANASDYYNVDYRINGGAWTSLASYRPTATPPYRIAEDTNNDGVGDGIQLSSTFQDFCYAIPATGNQIEIRVVTNASSTQSQFAFDNIRLSGIPPQTYSVLWSNSETTDDIDDLATGNYSVEITTSSGCVVTENYTIVDACTLLASFIPSETNICEGETITFTDNSNGQNILSWNWTFNGGIPTSATIQGPHTITFNSSGTYNIILEIEDDSGATDDTTIVITVNALPVITANNDSPFCDGESITLTASGGTSYSWTGPNSYSATGSPVTIPNASSTNAGVYSVTTTDANGCENSTTTTVVYTCVSYASFTPSETNICEGETITFTDNSGGGTIVSWNWTFNGGNPTSATTQGPHTIAFNASGTYNIVLEIEDDLGVVDDTTIVITVNTLPVVTANSDSPFCDGESITLTASGGTSYSWTGPNSYSATGSPVTIPNASSSDSGVYTVTATDANGCENSTTTTVVYTCVSYASFTPSETNICEGETITFTDNSGGGTIVSWSWTFNGGNPNSETTQGPHTIAFNASGTYNIVLEIEDASGVIDDTLIVVTVNGLPTVSASNNGPLCTGADAELTAAGGVSYSWTGPNGYSSNSNPAIISDITINGFGVYTVTVMDANGCQNTAQTTIQMGTGPTLIISGTDVSCFGGTNGQAVVTVSGGTSYNTYNWSPSGATTESASNLSPGTHTVSVTDVNGCVSQESVIIGEPTQIILNVSSTPSQCIGNTGTATVSASGGTPQYSYSWSPSGGNGLTTTPVGPNNYTVTVTDINGCQVQGTTTVGVVNSPVLSVQSSQNVSCYGDSDGSIQVQTTGGTPGYTYSWVPSVGSGNSISNLVVGTYTVTVVDNAGCTDNLSVTITQPTEMAVAEDVTHTTCGVDDGVITLSVTGGTGTYTYNWSPNVSSVNTASNLAVGTYNVVVSDTRGCSVSLSVDVEIGSSFFIDAYPETSVIDPGGSVNLNVYVDPAITVDTLFWTPSDGLSCVSCNNPTASPPETTTYIVSVISDNGCMATDTVTVIVIEPCGKLFVPTIFSPNGDGLNDLECVMGDCVKSIDFTIYNRWGEVVFHTEDRNNCWDGNFRGKPVQSGVYVYKLKATLETGELVEQSGNINVTR